jgi:hypothetical protein
MAGFGGLVHHPDGGVFFRLFSLPIFYPFLRRTYGWNAAQASAGIDRAVDDRRAGPIIGRLTDRFTPKKVLLTGMCISAVSLVLLSTIQPAAILRVLCAFGNRHGRGVAGADVDADRTWFSTSAAWLWASSTRGRRRRLHRAEYDRKLIETFSMSYAFVALAVLMAIPFSCTLVWCAGKCFTSRAPASSARHSLTKASEISRPDVLDVRVRPVFRCAYADGDTAALGAVHDRARSNPHQCGIRFEHAAGRERGGKNRRRCDCR